MTRTKKPQRRRRSFVFDPNTERDVLYIKQALGAITASEAMRYAIRRMAEFIKGVSEEGAVLHLVSEEGVKLVVDLPKGLKVPKLPKVSLELPPKVSSKVKK
jgi:hypothetical protein